MIIEYRAAKDAQRRLWRGYVAPTVAITTSEREFTGKVKNCHKNAFVKINALYFISKEFSFVFRLIIESMRNVDDVISSV